MTITAVRLFVHPTDLEESQVDTADVVLDVTDSLSGTDFSYTYTTTPNTTLHYWLMAINSSGSATVQALGPYTTQDITAPVVASASLALGNPATSAIDLAFSVTDNDPAGVASVYVFHSTDPAAPDVATVKLNGVEKPGDSTSHTFSDLQPSTEYYAWMVATDPSGNDTAVTAFAPPSVTTAAEVTISGFTVATGPADAETQVMISATIA